MWQMTRLEYSKGRFQILDGDEGDDEIRSLIEEISRESDRGSVIIVTALIEDLVGIIIKAFFQNADIGKTLLAPARALGSLGVRADLCCALGAISPEERRALGQIQKIRNTFAHVRSASFDRQDVADICANLDYAPSFCGKQSFKPRDQFLNNALLILLEMSGRPNQLRSMFAGREIVVRRTYEPYFLSE